MYTSAINGEQSVNTSHENSKNDSRNNYPQYKIAKANEPLNRIENCLSMEKLRTRTITYLQQRPHAILAAKMHIV